MLSNILNNEVQLKKYKAYFVGVSDEQKKEFKSSKCILLISVGQKYNEGGELLAAIKLVSKHFAFCNILVCDTLQRHSFKAHSPNMSDTEVYDVSKQAGKEWIERNANSIESMSIPYTVSRWDEWLDNPLYKEYHAKVNNLYNTDIIYKEVVDEIAQEFIFRRKLFSSEIEGFAFDCCIKYLLEEAAVACLWVELGYKFDLYPTRSNLAMIMAYSKLVPEGLRFGTHSLRLNIKKSQKSNVHPIKTEEFRDLATNYILTHTPGHIYWKNLDGVFLGCNVEHAKYFGFDSPSDIIGKVNADFLDEETAFHIENADNLVIQTGKEHVIEECVNGNEYFLSKKIPLKDHDNKVIGLLGTSINITERRKLKNALEETVKELEKNLKYKEQFIKKVNHEIRIPMQLILNGSQCLKDNFNKFSDDEKIYFLNGMIDATARLNELIKNLLDISKFQEGKFSLKLERENFPSIVDEVIQEFTLIHGAQIKLYSTIANDIPIKCDRIRIQQVLRNLFLNSIKNSSNSQELCINLSDHFENEKPYIKLSLKDQGVGISEEYKELVFEPFSENPNSQNTIGVGLGLSISKEIITIHKGKIWIDNLLENENGCRISFILPVDN